MRPRRQLLRGATLLTMEPGGDLASGDLLVDDGKIVDIGARIEVGDAEEVDLAGHCVVPGLVDAHIHLWQTLLQGLAPNDTLPTYFAAIHDDLGQRFMPAETYASTLRGALDQMALGVTTVFDWHHNNRDPDHSNAAIDALRASGMRAVYGHGLWRAAPGTVPITQHNPDRARAVRDILSNDDALVTMALAISGPGSSDLATVRSDVHLARDLGLRWSCHTGASGIAPVVPDGVAAMAENGLLDATGDFVHANAYTDLDLRMILDAGATITAAPEVELQMGHGDPVTDRVVRMGGMVALGVDTVAMVAPDMLAVARMAMADARGRLHVERPSRQTGLRGCDMLRAVTLGNAERIGLADRIGSLRIGKHADLAVFRMAGRQSLDPVQIADTFVMQMTGADVAHVWVGGVRHDRSALIARDVSSFDLSADRYARLTRGA